MNSRNKINIGFLIPNLLGGGAEGVLSRVMNTLPDNFNKHLILFDAKIAYPIDPQVRIINLNRPFTDDPIKKILNLMIRTSRLRNVIKKYKLDVLLSFLENANFVNLLTWMPHRVKRIISVRVSVSNKSSYYSSIERVLIKKLYNRADSIVCPSKGIAKELIEQYSIKNEKVATINNPCDIDMIHEKMQYSLPIQENINFNHPIIVSVGRLQKQKGHWHLIRAMKKVNAIYNDAQLVIIGEGNLHNYYSKLITELQLENRVFLIGFKRNPFVFIKASDVFVLPSIFEGFPNVLIEAMACGVPVIATDCETGPKEIISPEKSDVNAAKNVFYGEYGILTPPLDGKLYKFSVPLTFAEHCLADSIIEMLNNKRQKRKYSEKSKERAEHFRIDRIMEQFESVLTNGQHHYAN